LPDLQMDFRQDSRLNSLIVCVKVHSVPSAEKPSGIPPKINEI
jgi:hypothetical protein